MSTPSSAPRPVATITAVGTASPIAHGQAMMSTATAAAKARTAGAASAATNQTTKVAIAIDEHDRHEDPADAVGEPLDRRARALRLAHELHDLREHAVGADGGAR